MQLLCFCIFLKTKWYSTIVKRMSFFFISLFMGNKIDFPLLVSMEYFQNPKQWKHQIDLNFGRLKTSNSSI